MAFSARVRAPWKIRNRTLALGERTLVMGILNVTPDSFSDGGAYRDTGAAVRHALTMLEEGADLIDIGGESTRPGSQPVAAEEEMDRVLPAIEAVRRERPDCVISVDTWHAKTARAAVEAGAEIVNDVSGFTWDPEMAAACAELGCGVVLMHTRGRPAEWKTLPRLAPEEIVPLVKDGLAQSLAKAIGAGVDRERIVLDPGLGFGKAGDANYALLAHLDELLTLGQPLLAGVSRKSFLGQTIARSGTAAPVELRGNATLAATAAAILAGASMVRVHEVRPAVEAVRIADAILENVQGRSPSHAVARKDPRGLPSS